MIRQICFIACWAFLTASIPFKVVLAYEAWKGEWPNTDFTQSSVDLAEILSGGPPKDGIPSIDDPIFIPVDEEQTLGTQEPVISVSINGVHRAYPVRILTYHEIVNDIVGGEPIAVTYCPLCNSSLVFKREVAGKLLDFGTTGKLRHSDMIMYDRQTESWWQQFTGKAIVGELLDKKLEFVASKLESFSLFKARHPQGEILIPNNPAMRPYGNNPYVGYDSAQSPFLLAAHYDGPIPALSRVVAIGDDAFPLAMLAEKKEIRHNDLTLRWQAGQNSALDTRTINKGRDIGNVTVTSDTGKPVIFHTPFAFAFVMFTPQGVIHTK